MDFEIIANYLIGNITWRYLIQRLHFIVFVFYVFCILQNIMRDCIWGQGIKEWTKQKCAEVRQIISLPQILLVPFLNTLTHMVSGNRATLSWLIVLATSSLAESQHLYNKKNYVQILSRHFAIAQNLLGRPLKVFLLSLEVLQRERKTGFSFTEAYSESNDRSNIELFMKILNDIYLLIIFEKKHLNVSQGSE